MSKPVLEITPELNYALKVLVTYVASQLSVVNHLIDKHSDQFSPEVLHSMIGERDLLTRSAGVVNDSMAFAMEPLHLNDIAESDVYAQFMGRLKREKKD